MRRKKKSTEQKKTGKTSGYETRQIVAAVFLIAIITFIAFYPSLQNGFVNWDDPEYLTDNKMIKELKWENIRVFFGHSFRNLYQPLVLLSYSVEYHFFKLNPFIYHLTNLMLHLGNCFLLFWITLLLGRDLRVSFIAALLFGVHPMRVQSVAWVVERKDLLFAFFFLSSFLSYLYYREKASLRYYSLALSLFILSLLSKPMAITLPLIMLLYDATFMHRINKNLLLEKIPFFIGSLVITLFTLHVSSKGNVSGFVLPDVLHNIPIAGSLVLFYISKIIVPINLSFFYPYPENLKISIPHVYYLYSLIVALLIFFLFFIRRYSLKVTFGGFFFLIAILPVLQLVYILGYELAADRFTYIPSIGLIYIFSEAFIFLYQKGDRKGRAALLILMMLIISTFSFMTSERCRVWKNSLTYWNDVLAHDPRNSVAYDRRARFYADMKEYGNAFADFTRALELDPGMAKTFNNRGQLHHVRGDYTMALADYTKALELDPTLEKTFNNRGCLHNNKGEYDKALADFSSALSLDPALTDAYNNRGATYITMGKLESAIDDFSQALHLDPGNVKAYKSRLFAFFMMKDYKHAWEDVHKLESMGETIDQDFMQELRASSGREK